MSKNVDIITKSLIENFAALVALHLTRACLSNPHGTKFADCETRIVYGRKFANVDVGNKAGHFSGKYMVDLATGVIRGICAYGRPHPKYTYGTLTTIGEWSWGGYVAVRIPKAEYDAAIAANAGVV